MVTMIQDYALTNVCLKIRNLIGWIELIKCVLKNVLSDIFQIMQLNFVSLFALQVHMLIAQQESVFMDAL
jgi:hypothetical protein